MDMKPFNCHEAGDGDLYRRDEEGASLRGHLGLLDDAMAAVVAPRKLRLRKTWNCKYGKPRKKKRGGHAAASQACESPNPPFPRPGPCPCRQLQERGSARINASWGKEVRTLLYPIKMEHFMQERLKGLVLLTNQVLV